MDVSFSVHECVCLSNYFPFIPAPVQGVVGTGGKARGCFSPPHTWPSRGFKFTGDAGEESCCRPLVRGHCVKGAENEGPFGFECFYGKLGTERRWNKFCVLIFSVMMSPELYLNFLTHSSQIKIIFNFLLSCGFVGDRITFFSFSFIFPYSPLRCLL